MSLALRVKGKSKGGIFLPADTILYKQGLLHYDNSYIDLLISKSVKKRSYNQNAYYFGVVVKLISQETGDDRAAIHEYLKNKFSQKRVITVAGETICYVLSTTKMNTVEFEDYLVLCREWASDFLTMRIPLPNEIEVPDYYFEP